MSRQHKKPPVLTLIAGPNGSGKSTFVSGLLTIGSIGILVNADQIAAAIAKRKSEIVPGSDTQLDAAKAAEEMRWALLNQNISFATETVMSDMNRWVTFVSEAKSQGYKVVLYFVTTDNPSLNIKRVAERVSAGGHSVEEKKIVSRYYRVMNDVLPVILTLVDVAFLFDNSTINNIPVLSLDSQSQQLIALIDADQLPVWAKSLLDKFNK
jgi:predicted ABC-type ATPase